MAASTAQGVDAAYEAAVFRAKVEAAIRMVEKNCDFTDFAIYRMRVLESISGKDVAVAIGVSEPTVSRRLSKVREELKVRLGEVIATYSFTKEELQEAERNGLLLGPNRTDDGPDKSSDGMFDDAVAEIYHQQMQLRAQDDMLG